jgi:uncharacterized delta-60 repeat protein
MAVMRLTPSGTPDEAFGDHGLAVIPTDSVAPASFGNGVTTALAVDGGGRMVVAGLVPRAADEQIYGTRVALARLLPNGSPDPTFAGGGVRATRVGTDAVPAAVAVRPDGRIVVAAKTDDDVALLRYLPDGTPDAAFGSAGVVVSDLGGIDVPAGLSLGRDGGILLAGTAGRIPGDSPRPPNRIVLARYTASGAPDPAFGTGGRVVTTLGLPYASAGGLAVRPDGRIVVAGTSTLTGNRDDFLVAQFVQSAGVPAP